MNVLLQGAFNLRRFRRPGVRAAVIVDADTGLESGEVVRAFGPWASWLTLDHVHRVDTHLPAGLFDALAAEACDLVLLLSTRPALVTVIREECGRVGVSFVDAATPAPGSRELGLFQELVHHDAEMGGWNDWTKRDPASSPSVLRSLSATQCRERFPHWLAQHLGPLLASSGGAPIEALDVGCGPLSRLRWGIETGHLRVTGIDPLLDMYAVVLARHGLAALPGLRLSREIVASGEDLARHVPASSVDLAYSSNALDHAVDPPAILRALAACVRPGGVVALEVFTREGTRENWWALHQFDMYVDEAQGFVCETRDRVVTPLFPPDGPFEVLAYPIRNESVTAVVARRKPAAKLAEGQDSQHAA